jgi:hypothetical protein
MAFDYNNEIKTVILSMSLDPLLPSGSSAGYGFQMEYSGSETGSLPGAITIYDDYIQSTGTASLQIIIPYSEYLIRKDYSASLAQLVNTYTGANLGLTGVNSNIQSQIIYAPGEVSTNVCSGTCYIGELQWSYDIGQPLTQPGNYSGLANRQTQRPLKGGISITSTSHSTPFTNQGSVGTMGLVCQDVFSDALVGLTNNHVVIRDAFFTNQRTYTNPQNEFDLVDSSTTIQGDFVYQTGESQPVTPGGANEIGRVLRYVPIYTSASIAASPSTAQNKVDAAMFSLYCTSSTGQTIINFESSFQQLGLSYTPSMPFASTAEIDDLLNSNPELYSSGRTTGPKGSPGTLCPLRVFNYSSFPINYPLQGVPTTSYFTDVITFVKPANSSSYLPSGSGASTQVCAYPCWAGDSGSTIIANIGGVWKIIGLVFAGNGAPYNSQTNFPSGPNGPYQVASTFGYACRIDEVANQLKIKAWNGGLAKVVDHDTIEYKTVSGSNDDPTLLCSGSEYFQVGLTRKHNIC